jgi:hypothetical protein
MNKTIDRTGERNINTFGSEMIIVNYNGCMDIDVYFPEYDWTFKGATYQSLKKGQISCPYEKKVYGIACMGEGRYKSRINDRPTKCYDTWRQMIRRCYDKKFQEKYPTYKHCRVCDEWLNFQNFAEWYYDNFYEIEGETMCLDKDILMKHNKIYSPETCIFVPQTINGLFVKCDKSRGESVIGTSPHQGKYVVNCCLINPETGESKNEYLGIYDTQEKAFEVYKYYKEKNIKMVADYYFGKIPNKLCDALYRYEVEIDD